MVISQQAREKPPALKAAASWAKENLAVILMLAALYLFVSKSLYNVPVGIMAVLGLYRFVTGPGELLKAPLFKTLLTLFLCLWIPMLLSLPDAVNPGRSVQTVFPYLRFLFFGIYIIYETRSRDLSGKLVLGIFSIMTFWCLDALIQYIFGVDLFGYPHLPGTIHGVFYPEITIGHVTAALSPLYFHAIYSYGKRFRWLWVLLLPLFIVILLSGRRAAWIMLIVSITGYALYLFKLPDRIVLRRLAVVAAVFILIAVTSVAGNKQFRHRVTMTAGLFSSNYAAIDKATSWRLTLWGTSLAMIRDNWLNGIGPRGFRYVYTRYSDVNNRFHKEGQTHPHQLVLEVMTETGIIGLAGLVLFVCVFWRFVRNKNLGMAIYPCWLAVLTAAFPLNTHMAFYGSYWSSLFWWLVVLAFAASASRPMKTGAS